ncbi:primosomal protein DnaI [Lactococcus nasutitermitis]|uniref:Primosomal protein DnaI n=1 Tax=Lactococcus nasutitermitis TaxID=1652957 RepID=A0ABV9JDS7_9LACT|nr:primosomal protein DnaI [Lactococcus nasutitermitis]
MESISDILKQRAESRGSRENFDALVAETMKNPEVQAFIAQHKMTEDEIQRSYSKFYEFVREQSKFNGAGYEPELIMNHGYADVSYQTTQELAERQANASLLKRVQVIGLPKELKKIDLYNPKDVVISNDSQYRLIEAINDFIHNPEKESGLYVYGDFGVGKSYIMAAMANELAKRDISTFLVHYPTFVSELTFDNVNTWNNELKKAQVLVLDDIGAEMNNSWYRDGVLQVILQHRMQGNLPTFFTSNLTMAELEQHLAETKKVEDIWPAKRVMERIKYLSKEIRLEGANRRHD